METSHLNPKKKPSFVETLSQLSNAKGEFKLTMVFVVLLKLSFTFVSYLLSIFYIDIWELDDITAGALAALNILQILFIPILGGVVDFIGVKDSYIVLSLSGIVMFLGLAFIENIVLHVILISSGLGCIAILTYSAIKKGVILSTDDQTRPLGFSIYNSFLYLSTVLFGLFYELVFYLQGVTMDAFRTIFIVIASLYLVALFLSAFYSKLNKPWRSVQTTVTHTNPWQIVREVFNEKRFWRLAVLLTLASIPMGTLYESGFVLPIFMERELGDSSLYGIFIAIFATLVIFFGPLLTPLVRYLSLYDCVLVGGSVIGIAPFVFVLGTSYATIAVYIVITAMGGAIFECRLIEYNAWVAVPGKEGMYITVIGLTYSFIFIINGTIGGKLLEVYCPEDGERECWIMWFYIGVTCLAGCGILFLLKDWLDQPHYEEEIDPYMTSSDMN